MYDEVQLISDGHGLAVIGDAQAVDRYLAAEGLPSEGLGLGRLTSLFAAGSPAAEAASVIAENSGRWVKLTEESAKAIKKAGLRESSTSGLSTGVLKGTKGQIGGFVEFVKTPGALVTNPAVLSGAAGIMAQVAMQQQMKEITDYLATIDEKVDDVLRSQKDSVMSKMIGVGLVVDEAMTIREARGRVDDVTWSKVHSAPATIAETQAYALRQLDAIAEKMERKADIGDLAEAAEGARTAVPEWLAVLARTFQLQDGIAVLELDRVLDASPTELDGHRLGLQNARDKRLAFMTETTGRLLGRMANAASRANSKVLRNPRKSPEVVRSSNHVAAAVIEFHGRLSIETGEQAVEARRWSAAASDAGAKALGTGSQGVKVARRLGGGTLQGAQSAGASISTRLTDRGRKTPADQPPERD